MYPFLDITQTVQPISGLFRRCQQVSTRLGISFLVEATLEAKDQTADNGHDHLSNSGKMISSAIISASSLHTQRENEFLSQFQPSQLHHSRLLRNIVSGERNVA